MNNFFLITGMARSGTTLLDKLLDAHPSAKAVSQPIPMLYRNLKAEFFKANEIIEGRYVLNDLFEENRYGNKDLFEFLDNFKISISMLESTIESMKGWSGQSTALNKDYLINNYSPNSLFKFYLNLLESYSKDDSFAAIGTKEILLEEFIDYFMNKNIKVILVIRDPRDVITSLNFGKGTEYGGNHRPTLFHLRNWRKSIAIANTFENNKNCLVIKYEDLVNNKYDTLLRITKFLDLEQFRKGYFNEGIKSSNGVFWEGNSSTEKHKGINSKNTGKFKTHLSPDMITYIEYMCEPEMKAMGYKLESEVSEPKDFDEPFVIGDCGLDPNMSSSDYEMKRERNRLNILKTSKYEEKDLIPYFYSKENYLKLKHNLIY